MKSNLTPRASARILIACFALTAATFALAQSNSSSTSYVHRGCSNRTLVGNYGTQLEGTILGPNLPLRTLVLSHFDGEGNITQVDYVVLNGVPPAPENEWRPTTGTYTVNPDCTGSAAVDVAPGNPPLKYHFIVVKNGREILEVVDWNAVRGIAYRVE
ncbi:MAG: hypothetical protein ACJ74Z_11030 [Bryobacteraceae bacterium]